MVMQLEHDAAPRPRFRTWRSQGRTLFREAQQAAACSIVDGRMRIFRCSPSGALWWSRVPSAAYRRSAPGQARELSRSGVPVPRAATDADLARVSELLRRLPPSGS